MYGMLLESIQHYLKEMYGEETWSKIRILAGVKNDAFITHQRYSDDLFLKLAQGAAKVVGQEKGLEIKDFMKIFGTFFVSFFSNYGYDGIIRVTGRNFAEFLNSIDSIHEHMRFGYPKMESPSFYCDDETSTGLSLHYVSKRFGFKYYVIGQIEQVAKEFYHMDIKTKIIGEQSSSKRCHVIYRLEFNNQHFKPISPDKLTLPDHLQKKMRASTFFEIFPFSLVITEDMTISMVGSRLLTTLGDDIVGKEVNNVFSLRRPKTEFTWENLSSKKVIFELISKQPVTSYVSSRAPSKSLRLNGFHRNGSEVTQSDIRLGLQSRSDSSITQRSKSMSRSISRQSSFTKDVHKNGLNRLTEEDMNFLFNDNNNNSDCKGDRKEGQCPVIGHSRGSSHTSLSSDSDEGTSKLHLKGEMKFVSSWNKVIFVCSPVISGLDEMIGLGLYMSDLGIYDRSQEMLLSGITSLPQLEYARDQLIEKSKNLEENLRKLADERKRSDELLYLMMPQPIAERLKNGAEAIDTCEFFENVTVLFSYLDGFIKLCSKVDAMEIVALVDRMFTIFDCLSEKHDVYKFETLGDAVYMAVSGAPVRKKRHAEPMAAMAIAMIESMAQFKKDCGRDTLTITIGMHSGSAAAGLVGQKTPQYCLFGDTVNIASRLRNASLPMRINISASCNQCLKGSEFKTEFRGKIPLKGVRDEMDTFWLIGRKDDIP